MLQRPSVSSSTQQTTQAAPSLPLSYTRTFNEDVIRAATNPYFTAIQSKDLLEIQPENSNGQLQFYNDMKRIGWTINGHALSHFWTSKNKPKLEEFNTCLTDAIGDRVFRDISSCHSQIAIYLAYRLITLSLPLLEEYGTWMIEFADESNNYTVGEKITLDCHLKIKNIFAVFKTQKICCLNRKDRSRFEATVDSHWTVETAQRACQLHHITLKTASQINLEFFSRLFLETLGDKVFSTIDRVKIWYDRKQGDVDGLHSHYLEDLTFLSAFDKEINAMRSQIEVLREQLLNLRRRQEELKKRSSEIKQEATSQQRSLEALIETEAKSKKALSQESQEKIQRASLEVTRILDVSNDNEGQIKALDESIKSIQSMQFSQEEIQEINAPSTAIPPKTPPRLRRSSFSQENSPPLSSVEPVKLRSLLITHLSQALSSNSYLINQLTHDNIEIQFNSFQALIQFQSLLEQVRSVSTSFGYSMKTKTVNHFVITVGEENNVRNFQSALERRSTLAPLPESTSQSTSCQSNATSPAITSLTTAALPL